MSNYLSNTTYGRVVRLISALGIPSLSDFSTILGFGLDNPFETLKAGQSEALAKAIEDKILDKYPNVSKAYLRGTSDSMFRDEMVNEEVFDSYKKRINDIVTLLETSISDEENLNETKSMVWKEFERLQHEILQLQCDVINLKNTIDKKDGDIKRLLTFAEKYAK